MGKSKNLITLIIALTSITLGGCAYGIPRGYVKADEVTIAKAMEQTACALSTFNNELAKLNVDPGLLTDQIDVTMNLTASATGTGTLVLDTKMPEVPIGINYTDKTETKGERGNQIKISLKNFYTATLNDPGKGAVKRDGRRLGLGPKMVVPRDAPCKAPPYLIGHLQQPEPTPLGYVLDCKPYGFPNVYIPVNPNALTLGQREQKCTGIDTYIKPPHDK